MCRKINIKTIDHNYSYQTKGSIYESRMFRSTFSAWCLALAFSLVSFHFLSSSETCWATKVGAFFSRCSCLPASKSAWTLCFSDSSFIMIFCNYRNKQGFSKPIKTCKILFVSIQGDNTKSQI